MRKIDTIVLHHSASRAGSHTWEDMRRWHLAKGWADIGYHYGVVSDGRGWEVKAGRRVAQAGAHAKGFNATSIGVCFEGNFELEPMPDAQRAAGVVLIAELVVRHGIALDRIKMHRDLPYRTACPGRFFPFQEILGEVRGRVACLDE